MLFTIGVVESYTIYNKLFEFQFTANSFIHFLL